MDLNLLISTIITSTAALVAIIGGFLVSRVISLSSEQNSIKRRIHELKKEIEIREPLLHKAKQELIEDEALDFIKYNLEELLNYKPWKIILKTDSNCGLTEEELKPFMDLFFSVVEELVGYIEKTRKLPDEFDDFLTINSITLINSNYKEVYEWIYDNRIESVEQTTSLGPFGSIPNLNFKIPKLNPVRTTREEHNFMLRNKKTLEDELNSINHQIQGQEKILNDYGKPTGVWGGIFVLMYACIVGIVYPSTILPYPEGIYNDVLTKWFLLLLFFSELFALIIYLTYSVYRLTNPNEKLLEKIQKKIRN